MIELELYQIQNLMTDCMELGAKRALIEADKISPTLSKSEAYRKYSRRLVDRWLKEGVLKAIKDGSNSAKIRLNRMDLEILQKTATRHSYLTVIERK